MLKKKSLTQKHIEIDGLRMVVADAAKQFATEGLAACTLRARLYSVSKCTSAWLTRLSERKITPPGAKAIENGFCCIDGERMTRQQAKNRFTGEGLTRACIGERLRKRPVCTSKWLRRAKVERKESVEILGVGGYEEPVYLNGYKTTLVRAADKIAKSSLEQRIRIERIAGNIVTQREARAPADLGPYFIAVVHQADAGKVLELLT
jgi:hypothetical protein